MQRSRGPKKIAVIVSTLNNPWFVFLAETAAAKAKHWVMKPKFSTRKTILHWKADHFENAIASGYDAILIQSTDADGSVANVMKARLRCSCILYGPGSEFY